MTHKRWFNAGVIGLALFVLASGLSGCGREPKPKPPPPAMPEQEVIQPVSAPAETPAPPTEAVDELGAAAAAVDLIAAWAQAGAPESASFPYTGVDGATYQAVFAADILPLFTQNNVWFEGAQACTGCHFANAENSYHEMDLSSYKGILTGADSLEEPPGVSILGETEPGKGDFDWSHSKLRQRLRNNRMPPGSEFDITEANRDGPCLAVSAQGVEVALGEYDCELTAVGLIAAWVEAGAPDGGFVYGGAEMEFGRDVLPFFSENNRWFQGSQACTGCHFANAENSYHEMDLSSHQGILTGADSLEEPPGVSILGETEPGKGDFDWSQSKLRERLRNNRMPPGSEFDITEGNRDGPLVLHGQRVESGGPAALYGEGECEVRAVDLIAAWTQAGAPDGPFPFTAADEASSRGSARGGACEGAFAADILPLFTQNNVWFEGSQACTGCHFANAENSYHEMDLSSYQGILTGADSLEEPPGVSILGETEPGKGDFDWSHSKLRQRLRNNRMPPGSEFDITEANRDGPCLAVSAQGVEVALGEYDCELTAVGLIAAWVEAGAPDGGFAYGGAELEFGRDVLPFFSENNRWFQGSQACTGCHFANAENSYHEMDLSSHQGILTGADSLEEPPGVSILGETEPGKGDFDWSHSKLRERLRNNRMPPGFEFDITEGNRDGPLILAGTRK